MSHGYGSSSRGVRAAMGGGKNSRNFFPSVQSAGKKNALPKILAQNADGGSDKSDSSGLDVGVCTVQGRRPYQEDQYAVCRFLKDPQGTNENIPETHYFGVFDGHAGGKCSKAICSTIPYQFCRDESFATKLPVALKRAIQKTNEQFLEVAGRMRLNDGSTAVQVAIRGKTMTIANVGDSRAVLISGKKGITLTEDHKPSAPAEHRRIASFGGTVTYNTGIARVAGVLAVSRAFGNYSIRHLIRADPDVTQRELTEQDHYLVLASDGLWDVFRAAEVADICYTYERHGVQRIADYLVQMALTRGSMDNITAVVVSLSRYYNRMVQVDLSPRNRTLQDESIQREKATHSQMQRPASSGAPVLSMNDTDRSQSRQGPVKNRPSSGYAALNSSSNYYNRQKNSPSSNGLFATTQQGGTPSDVFDDDETLHGDLNEFNKSVDYSALNSHVNGRAHTGYGSRMHQRAKSHNDQSHSKNASARPRSSQHLKQSTDAGSAAGPFDRSSTPNHRPVTSHDTGRHSASPSNIMKRMFSRGRQQESSRQPFSSLGDDAIEDKTGGGNVQSKESADMGGFYSSHNSHKRSAGVAGSSLSSSGHAGIASGGHGNSARSSRLPHGKGSHKMSSSGGFSGSQAYDQGAHHGMDPHSRSGSAVDRIQSMSYSRGLHSPISTRNKK